MPISENTKYWLKEGIGWGIMMYFMMTFLFPIFFEEDKLTLTKALMSIPIWFVGGVLYGLFMRFLEKCFNINLKRKSNKKKNTQDS